MSDNRCVSCGKELLGGPNSILGDCYFCSKECAAESKWGYVVVGCDGKVTVCECGRDDDFGADVLPRHGIEAKVCCQADTYVKTGLDPEWARPYPVRRQECFDRERYPALVNRGVWALGGEVLLGDVFVLGARSCYGGTCGWIPLPRAEEIATLLRGRIAEPGRLEMPEERFWERFVESPNGPFYERCLLHDRLYPMHAILRFPKDEDLGFLRDLCNTFDEDDLRECSLVDATDEWYFCDVCRYFYPTHQLPLNDFVGAMGSEKLNEYVRSGRVKVFRGLRFGDPESFEKFRNEERSAEGKDWKVVMTGRNGVLVATSFPVKWRDRSTNEVVELSEGFGKGS